MTKMSAKRHLKELQWRLMLVALFFIAGACLAYNYQGTLVPLLLNPLHGEKLVYLNPAGGFSFIFLVSIYAGIALAFPVFLQQMYAFLRPALPEAARRKSPVIIVSSLLLLIAGIAFGYFIAVPNALQFLYGFADQYVQASLTADSYLNFIIAYTIGIGLVFQVPLLLLLINAIKPLKPGGLLKSEKWVVLIAFIVAAIITPTPDPINQTIIAGPVIIVYQIGVVAVLVSYAKRRRHEKLQAREDRKHQELLEKTKAALSTAAALPATEATQEAETPLTEVLATEVDTAGIEFEETTTQVHAAIIPKVSHDESISLPQAEDPAPVTVEPVLPTPVEPSVPSTPHRQSPKVIDGFTRRAPGAMTIPQRPVTQPLKPQPRPVTQAPSPIPNRRFYVDGIISPKNVAIQ